MKYSFNLRADALAGYYPFLIACLTLVALKAILSFYNMRLSATINGVRRDINLSQHGNLVFMDHDPMEFSQSTNHTVAARRSYLGRYEPFGSDYGQCFRRSGHC